MKQNPFKFALGLFLAIMLRLVPMPLPNFEPIMATMMPFARKYGRLAGFVFASLALLSFDFISGRLGWWTVYTGFAYGMVGFLAGGYFQNKNRRKLKNYLGFGLIGTIIYDASTALLFGWQFGQPLQMTIAGQIPFTIYHLMGNVLFISFLTPLLDKFIVENPALDPLLAGRQFPSKSPNRK